MLPAALQFLIVMIATAIKDRLQRNLDYTREEVSVLKEQVAALAGGKKLSFTARTSTSSRSTVCTSRAPTACRSSGRSVA
jgi:hypothetical protein